MSGPGIMRATILALASFILRTKLVCALNNWSMPCTSGTCSYDLPNTQGGYSGTLEIWGSPISDITTAAGWEIMDCDQNAVEQDIRLVCTSSAAACGHLYSSGGAEGKIVRLPESCGRNAFARVARAWVSDDQSTPMTLETRHTGTMSEVKALHLDTNFNAVNSNQTGPVHFSILAKGHIFNKSANLPINVTGGASFAQKVSCPPLNLGVEIDVNVTTRADITIDLFLNGSLTSSILHHFAMSMGLSADVNGSLALQADIEATLDSGQVTIFEVGLPGLDFPKIFSLGPTFQINAQAIANFDLAVGAQIGINYHIDNATIAIPSHGTPKNNSVSLRESPLQLSATPFVQANGTIEGHLIPTLNLGISAFGKRVQSGIYIALDSAAVVNISLEEVSTTQNLSIRHDALDLEYGRSTDIKAVESRGDTTAFEGCFEVDAVLDFNVGADADFLDLFQAGDQWSIFQETFPLYKKCFGKSANTTLDSAMGSLRRRAVPRSSCVKSKTASFKCRTPTSLVQVANQTISGTH